MSGILALISLSSVLIQVPASAQKASRLITTPSVASVTGRVTVHMTVGRTFGEHPVRNLSLYLIRVEDSKALQDLQRKCRRAVGQAQSNPEAAYEVCMQSLADAAKMVPNMRAVATIQTHREGSYKFENVPAGGRHQIVGLKFEGDEPVVIVGLTAKLKPSEVHKVDLSENAAWTDALPPAR